MTTKGVVTLLLDHPPFDLAKGGFPTKKNKKKSLYFNSTLCCASKGQDKNVFQPVSLVFLNSSGRSTRFK